MVRALPDLSVPDWTPRLAGLLERAVIAIGRLDARICVSPVRAAWLERASWTGFAEARRAQGVEIDEIDVFALAGDFSLPQRRSIAFAEEERSALIAWRGELARNGTRHWRELVPVTLDLPGDWDERPALLRALELLGRHARTDASAAPWLGGPALLCALGLTRTRLPCLVIADKALRTAPHDREAIVPRCLKALAGRAREGLERLEAAETDRLRALAVVAQLTRPGRLPALVALLQRRPLVSPIEAARALRLTTSGAGKLLARAAEAGLVVEISGRAAWKLYLTPDLAVAFSYVTRPVGRPPALPEIAAVEPVLARFDDEMASIDARLAELGVEVIFDSD